jgi:hypothetical protein
MKSRIKKACERGQEKQISGVKTARNMLKYIMMASRETGLEEVPDDNLNCGNA